MTISLYISNIAYKFGGTESYTANLIEALKSISKDYSISIITEYYKGTNKLSNIEMCQRLNNAYGVNIAHENLYVEYITSKEHKNRFEYFKFEKKLQKITKKYDLFIYCSRGLLTGKAKKNLAVIHFPMDRKVSFPTYKKIPLLKPFAIATDKRFTNSYDYFIPNSNFTSYWLKEKWQISDDKIKVLYPPVTLISRISEKKSNSILVCSRIEKSKKIEELIKAYSASAFLNDNCTLTIAGSIKNESPEYKEFLLGLNKKVKFIFEPSHQKIEELYAENTVFWHAKGFGEENPYNMEHFGITTVEAMSAGCIPVVINKGGQCEIVTDKCGFKWNNLDELIKYTEEIYSGKLDISSMQKNCIERSNLYSKENYQKKLLTFIQQNITTENK